MVAPVVFFTVVTGIAKVGDLRRLGRVGLKSIVYFELVTTLALVIGMVSAGLMQPGRGINANLATLDTKALTQYTTGAVHVSTTDFVLNIIPDSFLGAFTRGEMLQVLLLAVLSGIALAMLRSEEENWVTWLIRSHSSFSRWSRSSWRPHRLVRSARWPLQSAATGLNSLAIPCKSLRCGYATSIAFIVIVLGGIAGRNGINLWRFLVYIREELLIVLGTSSSEPALPRLMLKMENLAARRQSLDSSSRRAIRSTWTELPSISRSPCSLWHRLRTRICPYDKRYLYSSSLC